MDLRLNKNFYNAAAVKEALKDFQNLCKGVIVKDTPRFLEIRLQPVRAENKNLKDEFCNYLLGLMNNKYVK